MQQPQANIIVVINLFLPESHSADWKSGFIIFGMSVDNSID
jgi:hypothetical protein